MKNWGARRTTGSVTLFGLFAFAMCQLTRDLASAEPLATIGRASCASATCHGGISGQGPAWNSSLRTWEATDSYHAGAGLELLSDLSQRMVTALALSPGQTQLEARSGLQNATPPIQTSNRFEPLQDSTYRAILQDRCVSCHAPAVAAAAATSQVDWQLGIHEGVGCEACHGPASRWLSLHTLQDPTRRQQAFENGMLATRAWLDRTNNCLRCHVGSRTKDGVVRDMNHDLIAAGHPALNFDMSHYHFRLPAHWNVEMGKRFDLSVPFVANTDETQDGGGIVAENARVKTKELFQFELATPHEHRTARLRTLAAVVKLSLERLGARRNSRVPMPEFAEYNCFACHHSLVAAGQLRGETSRRVSWNSFYTAHAFENVESFLPVIDDHFRLGGENALIQRLTALLERTQGSLQDSLAEKPMSRLAALRGASEHALERQAQPDWQTASSWLWTNRLMLLNASPKELVGRKPQLPDRLRATDAVELAKLLDAIENSLRFQPDTRAKSPFIANGPEYIDFDRVRRLGDEYRQRLARLLAASSEAAANGERP